MRKIFLSLALVGLVPTLALAQVNRVPQVGVTSAFSTQQQTCSVAITGLVAASSATDILRLSGSATKTVKIQKILVGGRATTSVNADVQLFKRTAAASGGTATQPTVVSLDSQNVACTAVADAYTANPTTGAGTLFRVSQILLGNLTTAVGQNISFDFDTSLLKQPVTLRGVAEGVAVNLNGVTYSGNLMQIYVEWTEE